jgi:dihydrofolate synthase/folylpolyglutamate synthase
MIRACAADFDAWFLADLPALPRAARAADVAQRVHEAGGSMISVSKNPRQAWRRVFSLLQPGDRLIVFGSFFTVAGVLPLLDRDRAKQAETDS